MLLLIQALKEGRDILHRHAWCGTEDMPSDCHARVITPLTAAALPSVYWTGIYPLGINP